MSRRPRADSGSTAHSYGGSGSAVAGRRILPVVAIAAAVAAVGLAFLAYRKLGKSSVAPAEPEDRSAEWDRAWTAMRACVLGSPAASTDTGEAIAAADLVMPDRTCGRELVAVARAAGDGDDWDNVRRAIGDFAEQLGRHQQRRKTAPGLGDPKAEPDRLVGTLIEVETAVAKLTDADRRPKPAVLTALAATPIVVDGQIATQVRMWRNDMHVSAGADGDQYLLKWLDGVPHVMSPASPWTDSVWSPLTRSRSTRQQRSRCAFSAPTSVTRGTGVAQRRSRS